MAIEADVKVVQGGTEAVRKWLRLRLKQRLRQTGGWNELDVSGARLLFAKLRGACLAGADLSNATLVRADFMSSKLTDAKLAMSNLSLADFTGADLSDADLSNCDLRAACFNGAILESSSLAGADLSGATLDGTRFIGADLHGAKLTGARLRRTIFFNADVDGVDFAEAVIENAVFSAIDLSSAKNLDKVVHSAPSTLGPDTMRQSKLRGGRGATGGIPEEFLRGCGLQSWEVVAARIYDPCLTALEIADIQAESFRLLTKGPIFIGGVFISYAREDSTFVDKVYGRLQDEGANVWLDRHDAVAGPLRRQIVDAIRMNDVVLLVLSKSSVNSNWVDHELKKALQKEVDEGRDVLCPVALDNAWHAKTKGHSEWHEVREKHVLDFSDPHGFDTEFRKLVDGMKKYYSKK